MTHTETDPQACNDPACLLCNPDVARALIEHLTKTCTAAVLACGAGDTDAMQRALDAIPPSQLAARLTTQGLASLVKAASGDRQPRIAVGQITADGLQPRSIDAAPLGIRTALRFITAYCNDDDDAADLQWQLVLGGTDEDRGDFMVTMVHAAAAAFSRTVAARRARDLS